MNALKILLIMLLCQHSCLAQFGGNILATKKMIGKEIQKEKEINATEIRMDGILKTFSYDSVENCLYMLSRIKNYKGFNTLEGSMCKFDLNNEKIVWRKKISHDDCTYRFVGNILLQIFSNKINVINTSNGNTNYEAMNSMDYINPKKNIAIGSKILINENPKSKKIDDYFVKAIEALDLSNGKVLWKKEIPLEKNTTNFFEENDTSVIFLTNGFLKINTDNGKYWFYNTKTYIEKDKGDEIVIASAVAFGLLGALVASAATSGMDSRGAPFIYGIESNILVGADAYYYASKSELIKIDKVTNKLIWKQKLNAAHTSKSHLVEHGEQIIFVNTALANRNNEVIKSGNAMLGSFNKKDGTQAYLKFINFNAVIYDYKIEGNVITMLTKDRIMKYQISDGKEIFNNKFLPKKDLSKTPLFTKHAVFYKNSDGSFIAKNTKNLIDIGNINIVEIDEEGYIVQQNAVENYYQLIGKHKENLILKNQNEVLICDKNLKSLFQFPKLDEVQILSHYLFFSDDYHIGYWDLNQIEQ